ncbi:MAG: YdbH domain-containing protein [Pasteurellaceae bacterium]|nr:YdbH domain-containing protein [Pasteurellaceae bacterium]
MLKKVGIAVVVALFVLAIGLFFLLSSQNIMRIANHFLAPNYSLTLSNQQRHLLNWQLADLSLKSTQANCQLIDLQDVTLSWFERNLSVKRATLDYACLLAIPSDPKQKTSLNLTAVLSMLPNARIDVADFRVINAQKITNLQLRHLLESANQLQLTQQNGKVEFTLQPTIPSDEQKWHIHLALENQQITGKVVYHQNQSQSNGNATHQQADYQGQMNIQLAPNANDFTPKFSAVTQLMPTGNIDIQWHNPDLPVANGNLNLHWQDNQGELAVQDENAKQQLVKLPFSLMDQQIIIKQAELVWQATPELPLRLIFDLAINKAGDDWLPLQTDMAVQLIWPGIRDNLGIVSHGGEFRADDFNLPLEAHGNIKYGDNIVYNDLIFTIGGKYQDPILHFLKDSTLHVAQKGEGSNILTSVPLENVKVSRYGVDGYLQAKLEGITPQFDDLNLTLEGQANEFIAGIQSIFSIRDEQDLGLAKTKALNQWDWTFKGGGISKVLKTRFHFLGQGQWLGNRIDIQQLTGHTDNIQLGGMHIDKLTLAQIDHLHWDYENQKMDGKVRLSTSQIDFAYGGVLSRPQLNLALNGKNLSDFHLNGDLSAGKLGPINLQTDYRGQDFSGKLNWKPQSASVFQSLFPAKWQMLIQNGTIKGNSQFSFGASKAFHSDGKIEIQGGEILLPDSAIKGIQFKLPYFYGQNGFEFNRQPVEINIADIQKGELALDNLTLKVQGYYPYSTTKPLRLSELKVNVLGGKLSINQFALPQQKIANIQLQQIDLAQVLTLAQYTQLEMQGRVNAIFPFWLSHKDCLICNGEIEQAQDVKLRLSERMVKGLKEGGWTESILVDLVRSMDFQTLKAKINLAPDGVMQLHSQLIGYNPEKHHSGPITLNYHHQENVFQLWQMIDYGSQFEQKLQHNLYQQLEK